MEWGYGGAMHGFAANEKLLHRYCHAFGAEHIGVLHPYQFFIPEEKAKEISEAYDYE